jgi:hypothetical protein
MNQLLLHLSFGLSAPGWDDEHLDGLRQSTPEAHCGIWFAASFARRLQVWHMFVFCKTFPNLCRALGKVCSKESVLFYSILVNFAFLSIFSLLFLFQLNYILTKE